MLCRYCGTTLEDKAAYCYRCNNPTGVAGQMQAGRSTPPIQQHIYIPQQTKQPISIGGWIGRSLISCIPLVGPLVYLIMLFVWAGDTTKEDSFRNWAKAQLIIMGIVVGLTLLVMLFAAIIASSY